MSFALSCGQVRAIADSGEVDTDFERVAYNYHLSECEVCLEYVCEIEATVPLRSYPMKPLGRGKPPQPPFGPETELELETPPEPLLSALLAPVIELYHGWRWWWWGRSRLGAQLVVALAVLSLGAFLGWWGRHPAPKETATNRSNSVATGAIEPTPASDEASKAPKQGNSDAPTITPVTPHATQPARPAPAITDSVDKASAAEELLVANLRKPPILSELSALPGTVRGEELNAAGRILGPAGVVLATPRPNFRWTPVPGATSYQIRVADASQNPVLDSGPLSSATTTWAAPASLPGGIYSWSVTAQVGEEKVYLPDLEQPEAKFAILTDRQQRARAQLLQQARPSLPLAIFYVQAGMVAEARSELSEYLRRHPSNAAARQALRRIRRW